jgi:hypothetical protein
MRSDFSTGSWSPACGTNLKSNCSIRHSQSKATATTTLGKTYAFAPYLIPASTGKAWWVVLPSLSFGASFKTLGQSNARPRFGMTVISNTSKFVPPPASTSLRYKYKVRIRTPCWRLRWCGISMLEMLEIRLGTNAFDKIPGPFPRQIQTPVSNLQSWCVRYNCPGLYCSNCRYSEFGSGIPVIFDKRWATLWAISSL